MGKPTARKRKQGGSKPINGGAKPSKAPDRIPKALDEDTAVFMSMAQELKEEGNKLFQKRDHEGAMLKYEKALKLLPRNHIDVAYLRSNMAACFMQLGLGEYPRAISQCNLALEVAPKYSKALLKRARCYEALNRLNLALRDVNNVLTMEPNNLMALEIGDRVKKVIGEKGDEVGDDEPVLAPKYADLALAKLAKLRAKKTKNTKVEEKKVEDKLVVEESLDVVNKKDKVVAEEDGSVIKEKEVVTKTVKLVFGDDIRWAQLPFNCTIRLVRDIALDRFPSLKGVLIKYRDQEDDLVTITTTDELRLAEESAGPNGYLRLYILEVNPDQEPFYEETNNEMGYKIGKDPTNVSENGNAGNRRDTLEGSGGQIEKGSACIDDWIVQFAHLFKNHVGFNSDSYLDLHEIGMKLYSEAMEDTVTSEEAQELFEIASEKFQEMAALALFNWGNVHMSRARKRVLYSEDGSRESMLAQIKSAYDWAQKEYVKAGLRYEEALKIKPDFYEGLLALGQQQFEQAKLCWYFSIGNKVDLDGGTSSEVLQLYNKAEDSMERGMQMWEEMEERRLNGLCRSDKYKAQLKKMGLDGLLKEISPDEAAKQATNMRPQIYRLWGTMLYERSIVEYKLGLQDWEECLEVAVEKFDLAGASQTDIAVMVKNHCSNGAASEGLGFRIDEIVQAWNEMYDAKRWQIGSPSFRLEPLFRRQVSKLHHILEHF